MNIDEYLKDPSTVRLHFLGHKAVCPFCAGCVNHALDSDICICRDCDSVFLLKDPYGEVDAEMICDVLKKKGVKQ